jgi:hypothetical protein
MPSVVCPGCGEDERLRGERRDAGTDSERIVLRCEVCGATWDRGTTPRCGLCGSEDVEGIPTSTLQESGRGEQWAPSGVRLTYYCWSCRGRDVTSAEPVPGPTPPPGTSRDLRALRQRGRG